ncbi:MAG: hydroxylamine reductase, partial [Candidatus Bipolaricaulia bacterium]
MPLGKRGAPEMVTGPAAWVPANDREGLIEQGAEIGIRRRMEALGPDVTGLQQLLTSGLKGMAAYAYHARVLGQEDDGVYAFLHEGLSLLTADDPSTDELFSMCLRCGEVNLRALELLDTAHTSTYGHPRPTPVRITPVKGKAILVSGHDLKDLEELLKQTEDRGINVYTHGEMLPAHGYPGLRRFAHLIGNYGGAWQDQQREFAEFPS